MLIFREFFSFVILSARLPYYFIPIDIITPEFFTPANAGGFSVLSSLRDYSECSCHP